ncbi:thiamine pyrophosphate-binding protein [Oribacterium sp. HCP3S3_B9]|uniref:thiamine pyrophosphate-binding protein n=1 Tax=Oribacterium sp. HCP3S3_B9 TaxID=3438946 RepID=UPI003F8CE264
MKIKLANYISETLVANGITQNFSVTGGGAMHLNDAFGHQKGMHTLYQHHEQACAMAAESYARIYNRPALLCVTSGPGGTNAITGVLGAWLDSIPMLIISGQVRYDNTARWAEEQNGTHLRAMGDQEFDITKSIDCMTKYSEMLTDPYRVRYALEKCIYLSQTGRPGPCWLDIPVDIQGKFIETDELIGFDPADYAAGGDGWATSTDATTRSDAYPLCRNAFARSPYEANAVDHATVTVAQANAVDHATVASTQANAVARASVTGTAASIPAVSGSAAAMTSPAAMATEAYAAAHRIPADADTTKREAAVPPVDPQQVQTILEKIRASRRPIFYTGNGIRIAGAESLFLEVAHRLNIPVVVGWNGPDIIPSDDPLYVGRPGGRGDRPGNLAVQNADLILSIGSRLNIRQVGYDFKSWARDAYVIVNDIDAEELRKPSVHCDLAVHADARQLLQCLLRELHVLGHTPAHPLFQGGEGLLRDDALRVCHTELARQDVKNEGTRLSWLATCAFYRDNYPTILPEYLAPSDPTLSPEDPASFANVYALIKELSDQAAPGQVTVVGNGSPCVAGGQAYRIKPGTRFISQDGVASMGYGLPAAIGAAVAVHASVEATPCGGTDASLPRETADANAGDAQQDHDYSALAADPSFHESADDRLAAELRDPYWTGRDEHYPAYEKHDILVLTGDGSIQMNLQELQTIVSHQLPIKIFVINNGGYHSIRQTQTNLFRGEPLVGIGVDSGMGGVQDLSFPDMEKIAHAYGFPFIRAHHNEELHDAVAETLATDGPAICEIMVTLTQQFLPKSAAKRLPDGSIISPPLEDLAPYLPDEEMDRIMLVPRVGK